MASNIIPCLKPNCLHQNPLGTKFCQHCGTSLILSDRYEIQQQLAKNAGRQTLLARDLQTEQLVVVKILSFGYDFAWDDLKLFQREAETLKALSHPAIPCYLDYFELSTENGFALVQTYVEGRSLTAHLQSGRSFSEIEVKQLAASVLEILIYLHQRQPSVIHRDIKPSNILLHSRSGHSVGEVYLVDFGSVQNIASREGKTVTIVGTYGYMPLEQFGGRAVAASDLYSLGATLINLVTGTHPADLPQKDGRIEFEAATNLSPRIINWLRRMTEPSLERRFTSAQTALQALEREQQIDVASLVKKPTNSKVLLSLGTDSLEILITPIEYNPVIVDLCSVAFAWNSFITIWIVAALLAPFPINLVLALFSLPFWGAGISMVGEILLSLFGRIRLRIDRQQVAKTYELFGFKYNRPHPAPRDDISRLELTERFFKKDSDGDLLEVKPKIIIWAGIKKYEVGENGWLSEPELDWLVHELSYWLDLPVTQA